MGPNPTRRDFSGLALALGLAPLGVRSACAGSQQKTADRVIALDWGVSETLVALGHPPLGAAEIRNYDRTVVAPAMPKSVVDVGLRLAPNSELMQSLHPDLILVNAAQKYMVPSLSSFGAVEIVPIYTQVGDPYRLSCEAVGRLAERLGDTVSGARLLAAAASVLTEARARLNHYDGRPIYAIGFTDGRHVAVAGRTSLLQGVFDRLALNNAYQGKSGEWGLGVVGMETLAQSPEARVIYFEPLTEDAKRTMRTNPLWLQLPFVREGRVVALPPIWKFGALPTAMRFARMLGETLGTPKAFHG